mgnify:CR=1 FL=1
MKNEAAYQHEVIVPNKGLPFKLFLFEGKDGKYIREKHWHRSIEIFAVKNGSLNFFLNEKKYHLKAGDFVLVNSNEVHSIYAPDPNETIVLQIPLGSFDGYYTDEQFIWFSHSEKADDERVFSLLNEIYEKNRERQTGYELQMLSCFYQLEYLLAGKKSDQENLKAVAKRLLLIREGINASCLMADAGKRAQIQALALAIASGFLIPPAAVAIEAALILCWSFAESILDLRELFHGGRVPLTKTAATWQLSLENLPNLLEGLDSQRRDAKGGMSYEDYLQVLLLSKSKAVKLTRGMDMIEVEIRSTKGKEGFRLDCCIEAAEISVDVEANRKQTFSVTRQYSYI